MICLFASDPVLDGNVTSSPHVANRDSHKTGKGVAFGMQRFPNGIAGRSRQRSGVAPGMLIRFRGLRGKHPPPAVVLPSWAYRTCVSAHHYGVHIAARAPNELFRDRSSSQHTTVHVGGARSTGGRELRRRRGEPGMCFAAGSPERRRAMLVCLPTIDLGVHFRYG
ncbi:hypothetical protein CMUS01_02164 [Colletotrichum musicola]|uniref:Uncharacterized protein n=1 Tax=Colletotrichum musicola TaxID=2175873 RepID=A0A8H6NVJ2_9PEZI|nr:hypothetical protein CMUS01_02164 [Colletotrichum musicola]